MARTRIFPIILAAGPSGKLKFPKAVAEFGGKSAVEIAVENCEGLAPPIVVLGSEARKVLPVVPRGVRVVVNRGWRQGQLSSLLAGLRYVPRRAAFMIYPVDQPLITRQLVSRLVAAFAARGTRAPAKKIAMPRYRGKVGHPILCAGALRREFEGARSAREIAYRDPLRLLFLPVRTKAIWMDFDSEETYRKCKRLFERQRKAR